DRGADALVGVGGRHADVHDGDVRAVLGHGPHERGGVGHGGRHLEPLAAQQQREPFAQQGVVLGDHDTHGSSTSILVGPPDGLVTVRTPSCAATRRRIPVSPEPFSSSAPPRPSSSISTRSAPSRRSSATRACAAPLCLATLVSASATVKYAVVSTDSGTAPRSPTDTLHGTGQSAARAVSAPARPRSCRIGGRMPRTTPRSSP